MASRKLPRILVGTSGFSYPAWRGPFYPDDLPAKWETVRLFWPFRDEGQWQSNRHLMPDAIPEYDTRLRPPHFKSTIRATCEVMAMLLAAIVLLVGAFLLRYWLR